MSQFLFEGCKTLQDLRTRYHELAKAHHPDLKPEEERAQATVIMQDINRAYAQLSAAFRQDEMRENFKERGKEPPTERDFADAAAVDEAIRAAIEAIITLEGIVVEVCGWWVWVSGDTKPNKEALKAAGYSWSPHKQEWYFAGVPTSSRGKTSKEEIRAKYGSKFVTRRTASAMVGV